MCVWGGGGVTGSRQNTLENSPHPHHGTRADAHSQTLPIHAPHSAKSKAGWDGVEQGHMGVHLTLLTGFWTRDHVADSFRPSGPEEAVTGCVD